MRPSAIQVRLEPGGSGECLSNQVIQVNKGTGVRPSRSLFIELQNARESTYTYLSHANLHGQDNKPSVASQSGAYMDEFTRGDHKGLDPRPSTSMSLKFQQAANLLVEAPPSPVDSTVAH